MSNRNNGGPSSPAGAFAFTTATSQPKTRQELYDAIRATSKDEVVLEEMVRLGFWPPAGSLPNDPADEMRREGELERELRALRTEQSRLYNEQKLLKELRKQRLRESREKKKATKERRVAERKARKEAWQAKKQTEIAYLGEGVSAGLGQRESDAAKLRQQGLPLLEGALDVATAMGVSVGELRFLAFSRKVSRVSHYQRFLIPKKTGGERLISAPMPRLKEAQRWILENVLDKANTHDAAHGFLKGRSILSNALPHVGAEVVVNLDLKDFFPTVTYPRIKGLFRALGYSEEVATIFALVTSEPDVTEVELDGATYYVQQGPRFLPQGAPTSPAVTNLLCRRLDKRVANLAAKLGFAYTRYADDLTFSTSGESARHTGRLLRQVRHVLNSEGFQEHPDKTRVMRKGRRREVTGVVVNDKPSIERETLRRFRAALHHVETKGLDGARWGRADATRGDDVMAALYGYASFVNMIDRDKGRAFLSRLDAAAAKLDYRRPRVLKRPAPARTPPTPAAPPPKKEPALADDGPGDGQPGRKKWWKLW